MVKEMPKVGVIGSTMRNLVRDSIIATVRHWHILHDENVAEYEPTTEKPDQGGMSTETTTGMQEWSYGPTETTTKTPEPTETTSRIPEATETTNKIIEPTETTNEMPEPTETSTNKIPEPTETANNIPENDYEPSETEIQAFIEFLVLNNHVGQSMDIVQHVDLEAESSMYSRSEVRIFLKQMHDLSLEEFDPQGADYDTWEKFMQVNMYHKYLTCINVSTKDYKNQT